MSNKLTCPSEHVAAAIQDQVARRAQADADAATRQRQVIIRRLARDLCRHSWDNDDWLGLDDDDQDLWLNLAEKLVDEGWTHRTITTNIRIESEPE